MFVDMPLYVCPLDVERIDALRLERWYYNRFGTHNSKPGRLRAGARYDNDKTQRRRKPPRRRPVMSIRQPGQRLHSVNNACDVAPQKYSIAGQRSSFDLAAIVRQVDYTGGGAVVDVKPGRADLSNTVLLKRRYGDTSVTITFADDYQIRTSMRDMLRRKLLQWPRCAGSDSLDIPGLEPVVQVEIMEVRWTPWSTDVTTARIRDLG